MTISVTCPTCNQTYDVEEHLIGKKLRCKKCGTRIVFLKPPETANNFDDSGQAPEKSERDIPDDEQVLFVKTPSAKAYIGQMISAAFWSIFLFIAILIADSYVEAYHLFGYSFLPPLFIGGLTALRIWISVISTEYKLTNQRFFLKTGLIARHVEELELFRVKDVSVSQGIVQRLLGFGSVTILSTDDSTPRLLIEGIANPAEAKELIRRTFRAARKREGVQSTEFIPS